MKMAQPLRRCIHCGTKAVKPRKGSGRTISYRTMPCMPIPEDILIPTCGRCKSEFLDEENSAVLAPSLQLVYLQSLRVRIRIAVDILSEHISQRRLERALGLSQGYLSRLRAGAGNPSPELVSHLAILCQDPPKRLIELERFWALPDDAWAPLAIPPTRWRRRPPPVAPSVDPQPAMNGTPAESTSSDDLNSPEEIRIPIATSPTETKQRQIAATLATFDGSRSKTAQALGVSRRTLYKKLKELEQTAGDRWGTAGGGNGGDTMDETETATLTESNHSESATTSEPRPTARPMRRGGFAAMDRETHREVARSGGLAAHAVGLAHRFTPEKAREAGRVGGAKISANREHMVEIGRKGGQRKLGYQRNKTPAVSDASKE